jgi:hypothetical protein
MSFIGSTKLMEEFMVFSFFGLVNLGKLFARLAKPWAKK